MTPSLIQDGRQRAKSDLFGDAKINVKYAIPIRDEELLERGHHVELEFSSRKEIVSRLGFLLISDENRRRKNAKEKALTAMERDPFVAKWKQDNIITLEDQCGLEDGPQYKFLTGIKFSPATSTDTVPRLQRVVQADAAHMSIGKYTPFFLHTAQMLMVTCHRWGLQFFSEMKTVRIGLRFGLLSRR